MTGHPQLVNVILFNLRKTFGTAYEQCGKTVPGWIPGSG